HPPHACAKAARAGPATAPSFLHSIEFQWLDEWPVACPKRIVMTRFIPVLIAAVNLIGGNVSAGPKRVTLKGVVTKIDRTTARPLVFLDVKDPKGNVTHWDLELDSPNALLRDGVKRGHQITVTTVPAEERLASK